MVNLAYSSKVSEVGKGDVHINSKLKIIDVLLALSLHISLISVKKMCSTQSCEVLFTPVGCIFQEGLERKEIGRG